MTAGSYSPGALSLSVMKDSPFVRSLLPKELTPHFPPQNEREQIMTTSIWLKQVSALEGPAQVMFPLGLLFGDSGPTGDNGPACVLRNGLTTAWPGTAPATKG